MPDHFQPQKSLRKQAGELLVNVYWDDRDGLFQAAGGAATLSFADELNCDEYPLREEPRHQLVWERWRYDQWCNEMILRGRQQSVRDAPMTSANVGTSYPRETGYTPRYLPVTREDTLL